MDFRTPDRSRYRDHHQPTRRPPLAVVPPPSPPAEPSLETTEPKKRKVRTQSRSGGWRKFAKIVVVILVLAFIAWLAHGYITTKGQLEQAKNSPSGGSQTDQLIGKVGQLVDLPQGETPTIATVNDASKLKNQQFFSNAKDGDKVLIYSKAGKAVLYRPSTNRIIEYSTVNLGSSPTR